MNEKSNITFISYINGTQSARHIGKPPPPRRRKDFPMAGPGPQVPSRWTASGPATCQKEPKDDTKASKMVSVVLIFQILSS